MSKLHYYTLNWICCFHLSFHLGVCSFHFGAYLIHSGIHISSWGIRFSFGCIQFSFWGIHFSFGCIQFSFWCMHFSLYIFIKVYIQVYIEYTRVHNLCGYTFSFGCIYIFHLDIILFIWVHTFFWALIFYLCTQFSFGYTHNYFSFLQWRG